MECGAGILPLTASARLMFESVYCNKVSEGCTVTMTKTGHLQNYQCLPAIEGRERRDTFKCPSMYQHRALCHDLSQEIPEMN
jgi:hypothetical protein